MGEDVVIRAEGLGKKYVIGHEAERERYTVLRDVIVGAARNAWIKTKDVIHGRAIVAGDTTEEFWALRNVSFDVRPGEVMGVIGRNGAGKSTLLKILSRITEPTEGRVTIRGRVASLLEVGTGFHSELSGRENIFLNGAILGMSRLEIKAKFDEIVAFAGVERFLDTPVKRYSSGMYVRLAFAVAAHLEPEILLVDEVLAVGDTEFQARCLRKMHEVADGGRAVLFVSHNISAIQQLCSSGLLLDGGNVTYCGAVNETISSYMRSMERVREQALAQRSDRKGDSRLRIVDVTLHDEQGERIGAALCGQPLRLRLHYTSTFSGTDHAIDAAFNLTNSAGVLLTCFANIQTGLTRLPLHREGYFECYWPKVSLRSGAYNSTIFIGVDGTCSDWLQNAFRLEIEDGDFFNTGHLVPRDHGEVVFEQRWSSSSYAEAAAIGRTGEWSS